MSKSQVRTLQTPGVSKITIQYIPPVPLLLMSKRKAPAQRIDNYTKTAWATTPTRPALYPFSGILHPFRRLRTNADGNIVELRAGKSKADLSSALQNCHSMLTRWNHWVDFVA